MDAVAGKIRAGTPVAVAPAGTSGMTGEFGAIVAPSPMVTAPVDKCHPMMTWSPMVAPLARGPAPMVHTWWIVQSAPSERHNEARVASGCEASPKRRLRE